jgi:TRAP-type C4-dicarboxylate transport system permease small subunit
MEFLVVIFRKKLITAGIYYSFAMKALIWAASLLIFILMLYVTADVVGRYLLNNPLPATFELGSMLLVPIAFWAFAYVQARKSHMRLELLSQLGSARLQAILDVFTYVIGVFLFTLIVWHGFGWAYESWQSKDYTGGVFKIPYYPSKFALVLGAFFLWLQFIIDLIGCIGQICSLKREKQRQ